MYSANPNLAVGSQRPTTTTTSEDLNHPFNSEFAGKSMI